MSMPSVGYAILRDLWVQQSQIWGVLKEISDLINALAKPEVSNSPGLLRSDGMSLLACLLDRLRCKLIRDEVSQRAFEALVDAPGLALEVAEVKADRCHLEAELDDVGEFITFRGGSGLKWEEVEKRFRQFASRARGHLIRLADLVLSALRAC